jgi:hypothetical protein
VGGTVEGLPPPHPRGQLAGHPTKSVKGSRGSDPRLLGLTMGGYLIARSGSDPVDQRSTAPRVRPIPKLAHLLAKLGTRTLNLDHRLSRCGAQVGRLAGRSTGPAECAGPSAVDCYAAATSHEPCWQRMWHTVKPARPLHRALGANHLERFDDHLLLQCSQRSRGANGNSHRRTAAHNGRSLSVPRLQCAVWALRSVNQADHGRAPQRPH